MDNLQIGKKIKDARTKLGLTQANLAKKLGITWEMISRYENGRSSPYKQIDAISKVLKQPTDYFVVSSYSSNTSQVNQVELCESYADVVGGNPRPIFYEVPSWTVAKFSRLFALRLNTLSESTISEIGEFDIGIFSEDSSLQKGIYVLVADKKKESLSIEIHKNQKQIFGKLIYIERRFLS